MGLDSYSAFFISVVFLIGRMVLKLSRVYIEEDKPFSYFNMLVRCFILFIALLVFSYSIFGIALGWDGLGIRSYLLVIYYQTRKAHKSGAVTVFSNRVGDALVVLTLASIFEKHGISRLPNDACRVVLSSLFTIAAMTKRAQFPFSR